MRIGVHVKVAGGYDAAIAYAKRIGCTSLQFFSGNPRAFRTSPIDRPALERFRDLRREADLAPVVIHTSYLINLASEDDKLAANSLRLLENDLAVAAAGEVRYVNTHLGSFGNGDRAAGFVRVCRALEAALERIAPDVYLVLENSAGAGKLCGGTIDELGAFVKTVGHPQLAVCLDTAHSWAAGYDIHDAAGVEQFLALADEHIGLDKIVLFHFNDTQIPLGGHRDRHWHIGEGMIGFDGFRALVSHAKVREKVAILETPGEEADDQRNMQAIRGLLATVAA